MAIIRVRAPGLGVTGKVKLGELLRLVGVNGNHKPRTISHAESCKHWRDMHPEKIAEYNQSRREARARKKGDTK